MKPIVTSLGFGGALFAAALLVACGGGGAGGSSTLPSTGSPTGPSGTGQSGVTEITIQIPPLHTSKHAGATSRRDYVSSDARGLQVAVTAGSVTQTVYANISSPSPLCVGVGRRVAGETCTISIPVIGAAETIVATEVDATPLAPAVPTPDALPRAVRNIATPGPAYGSGFPAGAGILAVGKTSAQMTGSAQQIVLALNPVAFSFTDDCCFTDIANSTAHFGDGGCCGSGVPNNVARIVVTAGSAGSGQITPAVLDPEGDCVYFFLPSPLPAGATAQQPFVDVNGSATPITVTSTSNNVTFAAVPNSSPAAISTPLVSATSIPDLSYYWDNCVFLLNVSVSASYPTPAPGASPVAGLVFANNLTATLPLPFVTASPNTYAGTYSYYIVPISASPATVTVGVTAGIPATVMGYDWGNTMNAESAWSANDTACIGTGSASLTRGGYSSVTGQTSWTVTPVSAGTCTFYLDDSSAGVITNPVVVTINP